MNEPTIKAVIFDFDGTIADTFELVADIALKMNDSLKLFKKEEVSIEDFRNTASRDFIDRLDTPKYKLLYYLWKGRKTFGEQSGRVKVFPGVDSLLAELKKQNIKLAVVSSNSRSNVKKFLKANNLNYFDIVASPVLVFNKSHILKRVIRQLGVNPSEVLYVGDETRDIEAAHAAGIKAVSVTWGYHFRNLLVRFDPDYTIDAPYELLNII